MLEWVSLVAVPLLVAVIALLGNSRKANDKQHKDTESTLNIMLKTIHHVDTKLDRLETKVDTHIAEHKPARRRPELVRENVV